MDYSARKKSQLSRQSTFQSQGRSNPQRQKDSQATAATASREEIMKDIIGLILLALVVWAIGTILSSAPTSAIVVLLVIGGLIAVANAME